MHYLQPADTADQGQLDVCQRRNTNALSEALCVLNSLPDQRIENCTLFLDPQQGFGSRNVNAVACKAVL